MNPPGHIRLITTNDFFASVESTRTSYGRLPGLAGLVASVDALREEVDGRAVWVDVGDFSQGGPLATVTAGLGGFRAMAEVGVEFGVVGNHELDWGRPHLEAARGLLGFPLLAVNLPGLESAAMATVGGVNLGVVGVAPPSMAEFHPGIAVEPTPVADLIAAEALRLRREEGADLVAVAVHDGVDYTLGDRCVVPEIGRMHAFCSKLRGVVDAVLGGHTLARYIGGVAGIPYAQPWAFGAELGVIDIPLGQVAPRQFGLAPRPAREPWLGSDTAALEIAKGEVVGHLARGLGNAPRWDDSLPRFIAEAVLAAVPGVDAAVVFPQELQAMQPPVDGAFAFLAQGVVTEADLMRVIPWCGEGAADRVMVAEVSRGQLSQIEKWDSRARDAALRRSTWGPPVVARRIEARGHATVAMSRYFASLAVDLIDPPPAFEAAPVRLLDCLRARIEQG